MMTEFFEKFLMGAGLLFAVMFMAALFAPLGAAFGALGGLIVSWFYGDSISEVFQAAGMAGLAATPLWKIGAVLGFVGGFFKATITSK